MDGMKHRSASLKLTPSVVSGDLELHHFKAKKPGRGDGSELMRRVCEWADAKKQPLILNCPPDLVGFYKRFGFGVAQEKPVIMARLYKTQSTA